MKTIIHICLFLLYTSANAQEVFKEITNKNIQTSRIFVSGNELSYPLIELGSGQVLNFEFDELTTDAKRYQYEIIHCNNLWQKSEVYKDEYAEGFDISDISEYDYSRSTRVPYVHYSIQIPNEDIQLKISGNYVVRVFESDNPEATVVQKRFSVYELLVGIKGEVIRPLGTEKNDFGQEIRFSVLHTDFQIDDPFSQIEVEILQNGRSDQIITGIKPVFVRDNELVYGNAGEHIFQAGNEFRLFVMRDFRSFNMGVNQIIDTDSMYMVQLRLDERRSSKKYFSQNDMNGKYTVYVDNEWEHHLTADYAKVFFELKVDNPFIDGKVYLLGAFNGWKISDDNLMKYNFDLNIYEKQYYLKQGYYNYCYGFVSNYDNKLDVQKIEGSHYQTENDYLIKIFYKGFGERYYRLIGYKVLNTNTD